MASEKVPNRRVGRRAGNAPARATAPTDAPSRRARATAGGGYRKGDEARQRILEAALRAFGAHGFKGATTRQIADDARVQLPALTYYFGGKEGLYLACADEIVARYRTRMFEPIVHSPAALGAAARPADARRALKAIVATLAEQLVATQESEAWGAFVLREMTEHGPAFDILYEKVWSPGIDVVTHLIVQALGPATTPRAARIEALLLLSSLSAFSIARPVALRSLGWPDAAGKRFAEVRGAIDAWIDRLGRGRGGAV
jgi:AcrR family transcriptional regulator